MSQRNEDESKSKDEDNVICLDQILTDEVGQCGKYQLRVIALCSLLTLTAGFAANEYIFTFSKVKTRCLIPECENRSTSLNLTPPWILNAVPPSSSSFDNCHRYRSTSTNTSDSCSADMFDHNSVVECDEYVYEDTEKSAIAEFNLACDDWRPYLIGSINMFGVLICLSLTGMAADRWGRRTLMAICGFNIGWIGCLKYWAASYNSFLLIGLIENISGASVFSCIYILVIEYVGPKYRVAAGATIHTFSVIGPALKALVAWNEFHWRYLTLISKMPMLIALLYFWITPESVRWLLSKGRYEESLKILKRAAEINGNVLSEKTLKLFDARSGKENIRMNKDTEPWLVTQVFKHKRILVRCFVTPFWWITTLFVFYGLTMSSVGIVGNLYLNFCAVHVVDTGTGQPLPRQNPLNDLAVH